MRKKIALFTTPLLIAAGFLLLLALRTAPHAVQFDLAATLPVPGGIAEIVAASPDEKTLVYSDSEARQVGWVNISDPAKPALLSTLKVNGEPVSVAVTPDGKWALAAVDGARGSLHVIDMESRHARRVLEFEGQPDCVAVSPDGRFAAVAIENQRADEEKPMPQAPPGYLLIVDLVGEPQNWKMRRVSLLGLDIRFPSDPEPEYIAINAQNEAAVTLQENNAVAVVQLETGEVLESWSCGTVTHAADVKNDGKISHTDQIVDARREPDAIAWTPGGNLITANEGDYDLDLKKGQFVGGRNWTIFSRRGEIIFDCGDELELQAIRAGAYDDKRSHKRGVEPEGVAIGRYGESTLAFIGCERAAGLAVYDVTNEAQPRFVQWLTTGERPEGVLALPQRELTVAANEGDGTLSVFRRR